MNIGIDIDDTTFITVNSMIKYADIFDTVDLKRNGINGNYGLIKNRYYLNALYGWNDTEKFQFFDKYYKNVLEECIPMDNAANVINKLKKDGNTILFITARLINIKNCPTEEITKFSLDKANINYDKLIINAKSKKEYCIENNIKIFIEDSYETCTELENLGIKTYLMTTKMNKEIDAGKIERVSSWNEIYEKITKYLNK